MNDTAQRFGVSTGSVLSLQTRLYIDDSDCVTRLYCTLFQWTSSIEIWCGVCGGHMFVVSALGSCDCLENLQKPVEAPITSQVSYVSGSWQKWLRIFLQKRIPVRGPLAVQDAKRAAWRSKCENVLSARHNILIREIRFIDLSRNSDTYTLTSYLLCNSGISQQTWTGWKTLRDSEKRPLATYDCPDLTWLPRNGSWPHGTMTCDQQIAALLRRHRNVTCLVMKNAMPSSHTEGDVIQQVGHSGSVHTAQRAFCLQPLTRPLTLGSWCYFNCVQDQKASGSGYHLCFSCCRDTSKSKSKETDSANKYTEPPHANQKAWAV